MGIPDQEAAGVCGASFSLDKDEHQDAGVKKTVSSVQLLSMFRPVLERLINELKRSFDYCKSQLKLPLPDKIYLAGGGSLLKNIDKLLSKEIGLEVAYLEFPPFSEQLGKEKLVFLNVALAAALQETAGINLLPPELKAEKMQMIEKISLRVVTLILFSVFLLSYLFITMQILNIQRQLKIAKGNYEIMKQISMTY